MIEAAGVFVSHLGGLHQVPDVEQSVVDPEDNPVEQSAVKGLRHGVSDRTSLPAKTDAFQLVPLKNIQ